MRYLLLLIIFIFSLLPARTLGQTGSANYTKTQQPNHAGHVQESRIQMTTTEYQRLVAAIIKARKRRLMQRQLLVPVMPPPNANTIVQQQASPAGKPETTERVATGPTASSAYDDKYIAWMATQQKQTTQQLEATQQRLYELQMQINAVKQAAPYDTVIAGSGLPPAALESLQDQIKVLQEQQRTLLLMAQQSPASSGQPATDKAWLVELSGQMTDLQNQISDLQASNNAVVTPPVATETKQADESLQLEIAKLKNEIGNLQNQLALAENSKANATVIRTPAVSNESDLLRYQQHNIYFANGSAEIADSEKQRLQMMANKLKNSDQLEITIKAFASNVGSFNLNQYLSRKRAENVKMSLLQMGVRAQQILVEPLGVDLRSNDPANARRAEIHLIKK